MQKHTHTRRFVGRRDDDGKNKCRPSDSFEFCELAIAYFFRFVACYLVALEWSPCLTSVSVSRRAAALCGSPSYVHDVISARASTAFFLKKIGDVNLHPERDKIRSTFHYLDPDKIDSWHSEILKRHILQNAKSFFSFLFVRNPDIFYTGNVKNDSKSGFPDEYHNS